jgi:hypothetical protein
MTPGLSRGPDDRRGKAGHGAISCWNDPPEFAPGPLILSSKIIRAATDD